ncbi:hypothetical protein KHDHEBDM_03681 [Pectobacterium polaris]|nr:hypothetical protein KHDHEBDM_03681 [Pectobacterium polaris]
MVFSTVPHPEVLHVKKEIVMKKTLITLAAVLAMSSNAFAVDGVSSATAAGTTTTGTTTTTVTGASVAGAAGAAGAGVAAGTTALIAVGVAAAVAVGVAVAVSSNDDSSPAGTTTATTGTAG